MLKTLMVAGGLALSGLAFGAVGTASAAPVGTAAAAVDAPATVQNVQYYGYGYRRRFYGPRPYYRRRFYGPRPYYGRRFYGPRRGFYGY